ncbi:MAG TPA: alpha/beta fold hydrolase [Bacteroidota bacterium]|nr:alpha/beta fold hydrolase [Bacteroidota bacterium]
MPHSKRHIPGALLAGLLLLSLFAPLAAGGDDKTPLVIDGLRLINGTQLYCKSIGTGIPLLIIHGGPGLDHSYFLPQMEKLADTYELIFYDQRGCGQSTIHVDSASMTLDAMVEDIDKVRDAYNLNTVNLMGHSWGGLLAMFYAIKHGDRLNSLILVNSTPPTSALRDSSFRIMAARTSRADSAEEASVVQTAEFKRRDPAAMQEYFRLMFRGAFYNPHDEDELNLTFRPDYGARSDLLKYLARDTTLQHYDLLGQLENISCPVLIIGGDSDMMPPSSNEAIHSHIPGSQLIIMKNCGHFPFIEAPTQFFPAVRSFLQKAEEH